MAIAVFRRLEGVLITHIRFWLVAVGMLAFFSCSSTLNAQSTETSEQVTQRIELLIDKLASPNTSPKIQEFAGFSNDEVSFGGAYDKEKQVQVFMAFKALLSEDEPVIDILLKHRDDMRYSYTVHYTSDYNVTVGEACEQIVRKKIVGFSDEITLISQPQYLYAFFPDIEALNNTNERLSVYKYWERRKKSGLVEIQKEELDRLIHLFETVDGETVLPFHPDAQSLPSEEFKKRAEKNLMFLRSVKGFVVNSGKPYVTTNVNPTYGIMYGLPWSIRRYNK